jgi:hypothetical protein
MLGPRHRGCPSHGGAVAIGRGIAAYAADLKLTITFCACGERAHGLAPTCDHLLTADYCPAVVLTSKESLQHHLVCDIAEGARYSFWLRERLRFRDGDKAEVAEHRVVGNHNRLAGSMSR